MLNFALVIGIEANGHFIAPVNRFPWLFRKAKKFQFHPLIINKGHSEIQFSHSLMKAVQLSPGT